MTTLVLPKTAWGCLKKRGLAVVSALLIYIGIGQIVSTVKYPISYAIERGLNLVIERAFRDHMLLATPPYSILGLGFYMAKSIAIGVIAIVIGTFVSLLADLKGRHRQMSKNST
jgi:hypothetical protein